MATAADSSSGSLHSPWAKVVRGDSESSSSSPPLPSTSPPLPAGADEGGDSSGGPNGNAAWGKKPVWNRPSKGAVVEVGEVMGAAAWPALSDSAMASSPRLPADSSSNTVTVVSAPPQPVSPGLVIARSPNSKKLNVIHHANSNPASSAHAMPARQKPAKHSGNSSSGSVNVQAHSHASFAHRPLPPPPPLFPVFPLPNGYGTLVPAIPNPSPRDPSFRGRNWEARPIGFGSQMHQVNEPRNSSRRGNLGSHTRADGHFHNNFGNKRDRHDRGNLSSGVDVQMHQQHRPAPRGVVRPVPPSSAAFASQPARPFANQMGFGEFFYFPTLPLDPIRMPFIPHAQHPAMFVAGSPVPPLPSLIVNQIDYYFSDTNLIRDEYLRSNMDAQGWVPISLIANFHRVQSLTTDVQLIMDSLRASSIVEVQDNKVRRRNDWLKWIATTATSDRFASESGSSPSDTQSSDILSTSFLKMTVGDPSTSESSMAGNSDANQATSQTVQPSKLE